MSPQDIVLFLWKFKSLAGHRKFPGNRTRRFCICRAGKSRLLSPDADLEIARFNDAFPVIVDDGHLPRRNRE